MLPANYCCWLGGGDSPLLAVLVNLMLGALKKRPCCEKDSDCLVDFGCCSDSCINDNCFNKKMCDVSNSEYIKKHSFSCDKNVDCKEKVECISSFESECVNNICRIIS